MIIDLALEKETPKHRTDRNEIRTTFIMEC
jgi:hypothetical protein